MRFSGNSLSSSKSNYFFKSTHEIYYLKKACGKGQAHSSVHLRVFQKHLQRAEILQFDLPCKQLRHYECVSQKGENGLWQWEETCQCHTAAGMETPSVQSLDLTLLPLCADTLYDASN